MSAPTWDDRAALAERLDALEADRERFADRVSELYRTDPECQATRSKVSFSHARALAWHKAMQERIASALAAPPRDAALAERLTDLANHLARAQKEIDESADVRETVGEIVRGLDALRVEVDAAPAVPPSVAEAREAFVLAVARCRDCGEYGVLCGPQHEALADALIAAVRAATAAEAVRVVAGVPRYVLGLNLWQGTAPTMEPAANGAWIGQAEAMNALRALEVQP